MDTKPDTQTPAEPEAANLENHEETPKKLRLEPTRYGDWELNGKCVDF